jgi:hypothetical protein
MTPNNQTTTTRLIPKFSPMAAPAWQTVDPNPSRSPAQLKSSKTVITLANQRIMATFQIANAQVAFRHVGMFDASSLRRRPPEPVADSSDRRREAATIVRIAAC